MWLRFQLSHTTPALERSLGQVPGLTRRGTIIDAHDNAAWLVEKLCRQAGVEAVPEVLRHDGVPLERVEDLVANGLREWVPGFLTEYQREGILSMAHRDGHFWWAAGSGKTLGAICWALADPGATVLVTKAGVRRQHGREIERVTTHRAAVIETLNDVDLLWNTDAFFAVVGFEMLPNLVGPLKQWGFRNLIIDECHMLKNHRRWEAKVGQDGKVKFSPLENIASAAYQLSRAAKRRLGTTATPIKDRTRDLWAQLDLIHPDAWGRFYSKDRASFAARYCDAFESRFGGVDHSGSSNLEELWGRVSIVTHHVPHSVTHRSLPPRRRVVTYVTPAEQVRPDGFNKALFAKAAKNGPMALLEARLTEAAARKRKALIELVEEAVASGQKVTVFTGRREDCERLAEEVDEALGKGAKSEGKGEARKQGGASASSPIAVYMSHGGVSVKERDAMVQAYMKRSEACVFIGTGEAHGTGISLHDTDLAIFAMLPYTPGSVIQWEGRFSRHGQKRPVLVQYLIAEGTIDEHVVDILLGKLAPVEDVSREDSLEGFADSLKGFDSEEEVLGALLEKLG